MSSSAALCGHAEQVYGFVAGALPPEEAAEFAAHFAGCEHCRGEVESLHSVIASFVDWPVNVLKPPASLWERLSARIEGRSEESPLGSIHGRAARRLEWKEVASGISCVLLATDRANDRVSMLVRLAPGTDYPPHRHAGLEELHLLHGELWIDDRKLYPGDYNRAEPGTSDARVWSETGCTCVLITSPSDVLG